MDDHSSIGHTHLIRLVGLTPESTHLNAARTGNLEGLLAVLDPEAVLRIDGAARIAFGAKDAANTPRELKGASTWAKQLVAFSLGLRFATYVHLVQVALIDGTVGVVVAPFGRLSRVLIFTFAGDRVTRIDVIGDAARLRELEIVAI